MKFKIIIFGTIILFLTISIVLVFKTSSMKASSSHINKIYYTPNVSSGSTQEMEMLKNGQISMITGIGNLEAAKELEKVENVKLYKSPRSSNTISCVFFNMRRSPCDDVAFRYAIASVVNREYITKSLFKGLVDACNTFVPPLSDEWTNKKAAAPSFDSIKARKLLDSNGYIFDKISKLRINPKTGNPLKLTMLTPLKSKSPVLWNIGYTMSYYMKSMGIKTEHIALADHLLNSRTMLNRDFDILAQDINMAQAPFGLYPLLHSSRDQKWTFAYSGMHDSNLDKSLEKLWFGINKAEVQKAAAEIQASLHKSLPYVAVCSAPEMAVAGREWEGAVNMPGYGISNMWTYLSIHKKGGNNDETLILNSTEGFTSLNPITATNTSEWSVLKQIFSPLFYYDFKTMKDKPVLAKSWDLENISGQNGTNCMKVTFHLLDGVKWHDGIPFTAKDIKFCIDFLKNNNVENFKDRISIINEVKAPDDLTIEIFLNECGYRHLYDLAWFTFMPQHIWEGVKDFESFKPWNEPNPMDKDLTKLVGQGPFIYKGGSLGDGVTIYWNQDWLMAK